nr:ribonuclease H-like domain-containing protein [Tanacetum cinerariifolium]
MAGKESSQPPQPPTASTEAPYMVLSMTKDEAGYEIEVPPVAAQQILKASAALMNIMLLIVFLLLHAIVLRHKLDKEDLEQIDQDDLEEMDHKWQVAMLSIRVKQFYKKTKRKLEFNGKEPVGFVKNKVERKLV